ncbi:putative lipoprotein [Enhygromyxa salina]|uniref:Putative lipoprotein n=1 Tax=Enhygromyxa salina TaxID=215803 RepID=A0A0C2DIP0_9BACT|nr:hypothetical protein [Enhygromyxa salina]KIG19542.1 putative lipoprotein [Enhygromyxa salina]
MRSQNVPLGTHIPDIEGCPGTITSAGMADIDEDARKALLGMRAQANIDHVATRAKRAAGEADACCYTWMEQCPGGRPLLDDRGQPQLAELVELGQAGQADTRDELPTELRQRLAQAWLADALIEHASIASFLRVRAELEAVGAPDQLLAACERAAVDEQRHAARCFELAARYGRACAPASSPQLAPRDGGLIRVAIDTFIEGCVGETVAAAGAQRAARGCTDPAVAQVLAEIADDESEHAALAWRTLAWAIAKHGAPVLLAVREVSEQLRPTGPIPTADPHAQALAEHGRLDPRAQAQLRHATWATIIDPMLAELQAG